MKIEDIINGIIISEGGYVNNKSDKGGPTKYGITQATLSSWVGRRATIDQVKNISKDTAYNIYYKKYYKETHICDLPEEIQPIMLDITVNSWVKVATVLLQNAINMLNNDTAIEIDGKLGPRTIEEARKLCSVKPDKLINAIVYLRIDFYKSIVENNPSQDIFLAGWINRANTFLT